MCGFADVVCWAWLEYGRLSISMTIVDRCCHDMPNQRESEKARAFRGVKSRTVCLKTTSCSFSLRFANVYKHLNYVQMIFLVNLLIVVLSLLLLMMVTMVTS